MVSVKCLLGHYADPRLQTFNIVLMQKGKKQRLKKLKFTERSWQLQSNLRSYYFKIS